MNKEKSFSFTIFLTVAISLLVLAIAIAFMQTVHEVSRANLNTKSLVKEQISLTVKKLDAYRVVNQRDYIAKTIFGLDKVNAVFIFDRNCVILRKQPINSFLEWNCSDKLKDKHTIIFHVNNIYSNSDATPKFIVAKLKSSDLNFFRIENMKLILLTFLVILIAIMILVFLIKKLISTPLNILIESIKLPMSLRDNLKLRSQLPKELLPIYRSIIEKDQLMHDIQEQLVEQKEIQAAAEVSRQVAHDIQSPIGALNIILETSSIKPESSSRLLSSALQRIKSIVDDLENPKGKIDALDTPLENIRIKKVLEEIVFEKNFEHQSKKISLGFSTDLKYENSISRINESDFKRILSNIINNSIEAINHSDGEVYVTLKSNNSSLHIQIEDNGHGIKKEFQKHIFEKGATFGKPGGQGLGLYFSSEKIKSWKGRISLLEKDSPGTTFLIELPTRS